MSTYVFDLDGTLGYTTGREYEATEPYADRIAYVNHLYDIGHTIVIDSARGSVTGDDWQARTKAQLDGWGLKYHQLRTGVKFFAECYIDDKACTDVRFFPCG